MSIRTSLCTTLLWAILFAPFSLYSQDTIRSSDIEKFSYSFDIINGTMSGPGAEVLTKAITNTHILMLGSNSRNQMESDLDHALIALLNKNDYKNVIMETGPFSASIVNNLTDDSSKLVAELKEMNQSYAFEAGASLYTPIPDLKYMGTGQLVAQLKENGWTMGGIGVESWTAYNMIFDELYLAMSKINQAKLKSEYEKTSILLDRLYADIQAQTYGDIAQLINGLRSSKDFNSLLEAFKTFSDNNAALESLHFSLDYWEMYGDKKFYEKNKLNAHRNKVILKKELQQMNFDFTKDKLLLKMWRNHLTNGVTPNGFYGVGNMLMELAAYHGHKSLNIGILERYTTEDNQVVDRLNQEGRVAKIHQPFVSLGQKDKWMLIDLRPFTETFYWGNYIQTKEMLYMMRSYDMIIIPKTDYKAKVNH